MQKQLDQMQIVRKLSASGVSLERIRQVRSRELLPVPPRQRQAGSVEVRSHLLIANGVELEMSP